MNIFLCESSIETLNEFFRELQYVFGYTNNFLRETMSSGHNSCWQYQMPHVMYHAYSTKTVPTLPDIIGLLQLAVTWYKIRHAGEQAYYYSCTGTAKQCYFILSNLNFLCFGCPSAGIIISLLSSMADFVSCDR